MDSSDDGASRRPEQRYAGPYEPRVRWLVDGLPTLAREAEELHSPVICGSRAQAVAWASLVASGRPGLELGQIRERHR